MRLQDEHGFTLMELVTVLAIVGILAAVAIPNFLSWLPNMRLKAAARDLYSNMQKMRIMAVKSHRSTAIVFDTTNNRYYLCDDSGADGSWTGINDPTGTGDNNIVQTVDLNSYNSGVGYGHGINNNPVTTPVGAGFSDNVTYGSNRVVFNSQGLGDINGYAYLDHKDNTTTYAVGSLTSGVIKLVKWKSGTWQ